MHCSNIIIGREGRREKRIVVFCVISMAAIKTSVKRKEEIIMVN